MASEPAPTSQFVQETRLLRKCRVLTCEQGAYCRGLCADHYRLDLAGTLTEEAAPLDESLAYPNSVAEATVSELVPEGQVRRETVEVEVVEKRIKNKAHRGRQKGAKNLSDEFILMVRGEWVAGKYKSDGDLARAHGIRGQQVGFWRRARKPDGRDWHDLKAEALGVREPIRVELVPAKTADALTLNRICAGVGERYLALFMGLSGGGLFYTRPTGEAGREAISQVYTEDNQPVPLSTVQATKFSDLIPLGTAGTKILRDCVEVMAALQESQAEMDRLAIKRFAALAQRLHLSAEQLEELAEMERTGAILVPEDAPAPCGVVAEGEFEVEDDNSEADDEEASE